MNKLQFIRDLAAINNKLAELKKQRDKLVSDHSDEIKRTVRRMMDWKEEDINCCMIEYSDFEKCVMVEVYLIKEPSARYVFEIKDWIPKLRFREDRSMHC
jgi:hypothetical protein